MESDLFRQIVAIAVVFGMLGAAVWLLGTRRGRGPHLPVRRNPGGSYLQVIEKTRITPQQMLLLIRVGKRGLVLAVHPAGCTVVASQPMADLLEEASLS